VRGRDAEARAVIAEAIAEATEAAGRADINHGNGCFRFKLKKRGFRAALFQHKSS
jgi:hypothetical protein